MVRMLHNQIFPDKKMKNRLCHESAGNPQSDKINDNATIHGAAKP